MRTILLSLFSVFLAMNVCYAASQSVHRQAIHKVSINKAAFKELAHVKGVSAYKAHNIVRYRKKHGAFKSFADLKKVRGFKRMKAEKLTALTARLAL